MKLKNVFTDGIIKNNPVLVQMIGMCSVLAVSTSVINAVGMSLAVTFVLVCSNVVISLLRNFIPDEVRIPAFIVVIATFVTIVEMVLHAFVPVLYNSLGLFLPLIVVNCIILGRAEAFASKNGLIASIVDGFGQGIGYLVAIGILAAIRELLGKGTLAEIRIIPEEFTFGIFNQPAAAFIVLGFMIVGIRMIQERAAKKEEA